MGVAGVGVADGDAAVAVWVAVGGSTLVVTDADGNGETLAALAVGLPAGVLGVVAAGTVAVDDGADGGGDADDLRVGVLVGVAPSGTPT